MRTLVQFVVWLVANHPYVALTLGGALFGAWGWGQSQRGRLIPKWVPVFAVPAVAIWLLARKTKSGRRGITVATPVLVPLFLVAVWWFAPQVRGPALALILVAATVAAIMWFDQWLGVDPSTGVHHRWTRGAVRAAWARDDATLALHAGVQHAIGGKVPKAGKAHLGKDGRHTLAGTLPPGVPIGQLEDGAASGALGGSAGWFGLDVTGVEVTEGAKQGQFMVTANVTPKLDLSAPVPYPRMPD